MLEMDILDQKDLGRRDEMARVLCMLDSGGQVVFRRIG
jgi:hypothetical protein